MEKPRMYWAEPINSFPAFAQNHEDYNVGDYTRTGDVTDAVVDTGLTHRAFLPFASEDQRGSISTFSGTATVVDSRVVCVRPRMHAGHSIALVARALGGSGGGLLDRWFLSGAISVDPDVTPAGLILAHEPVTLAPSLTELDELPRVSFFYNESVRNGSFYVDLEDPTTNIMFGQSATEWNVVQSDIAEGPRLLSSLDPRYPQIVGSTTADIFNVSSNQTGGETTRYEPAYYLKGDKIPLMTGRAYQLMNITPAASYPTFANQTDDSFDLDGHGILFHVDPKLPELRGRAEQLVVKQENEWLVFTVPKLPGWRIATTLCFDSFVSFDANVSLRTEKVIKEPI
ncbi:hypothetical protein CkaCkLH20_04510 [Colletotrichum karsti]|uniref:Uncharacterized protein n=1 Tax=Colletotrichum karsti TaxID=1095194 RepID=A0A9P6LJ31_9PEZI|nr:uncharacterized protein CkaCkLH20_04510 [Colletotrichum karsti]KAF9877934.1 hypothetical protein CkaCkLH20_04510 [Colletotrichum karsti]